MVIPLTNSLNSSVMPKRWRSTSVVSEGCGKCFEACAAISLVVSVMMSLNLEAPKDRSFERFAASSAKLLALFHSSIFLFSSLLIDYTFFLPISDKELSQINDVNFHWEWKRRTRTGCHVLCFITISVFFSFFFPYFHSLKVTTFSFFKKIS